MPGGFVHPSGPDPPFSERWAFAEEASFALLGDQKALDKAHPEAPALGTDDLLAVLRRAQA